MDFDSFSPFWIHIDDTANIIDLSETFSDIGECQGSFLSYFDLVQPNEKKDCVEAKDLLGKILIIKKEDYKYRGTIHPVGHGYLIVCWPILANLKRMKEEGLARHLNHPACIITDFLMIKDVVAKSQNKIYELELEATKSQLKKEREMSAHRSKLASLGELAAGVGHEINNPLAIVMGNLSLLELALKKEGIESARVNQCLERSLVASRRIQKIVTSLSKYSRKTDTDDKYLFDLRSVASSVMDMIEEIYAKQNIKVSAKLPSKPLYVFGNYGEMEQALLNLIKNAADAIGEKPERNIDIEVCSYGLGMNCLSVADSGSGIPAEYHDKIFEPFWTSKDVGKGTGLGLGFVVDFVKRMNGKVEFKTKLNEGTSFYIILPDAQQMAEINEIHSSSGEDKNMEKKSILLVDDETDFLSLVAEFLEDEGYDVTACDQPLNALKKIESKKFDIVISDMMMPKMTGDEFIKKAHQINGAQGKYLIVTGGMGAHFKNDESFLAVVSEIISKPLDFTKLLEAIEAPSEGQIVS